MTVTADVIVIGAGAIGSATAWWLSRRGYEVVLLEQFTAGHDRGSSHGGSRIFRLAYPDDHYVELAREARDLWRELEDDAGESLLEITGGIDHGEVGDLEPIARALGRTGCAFERLTPGEAAERWPGMRFEGGVIHSPDAGRVLADKAVAALQRRATELGAMVRSEEPARRIDPARNVVSLDAGDLHARESVVVTAGAWVAHLLAGTGFELPALNVTREQVLHFTPAGAEMPWPSFIHHAAPPRYGLLTPGEGVKVAEHGTGPVVDPDTRGFEIDDAARRRVVDYVSRWLPGLVPEPVTATTCLYTNTPDASFVIDRRADLVVGSACSGHGFKFTPAIGRALADLAVARG